MEADADTGDHIEWSGWTALNVITSVSQSPLLLEPKQGLLQLRHLEPKQADYHS